MAKWLIHLTDGRTLTDKDAYPHDVPSDQITSVERIVDNRVYTICGSPVLKNFFVKTTAAQSLSLVGKGVRPPEILERIIGCYIEGKNGPVRLELVISPSTGNCKLIAIPVRKITKDGF